MGDFIIDSLPIILFICIYFIIKKKNDNFPELYIDNSTSAIIAIDLNETTVIFNQTAEDLFGIPREEVLGKSFNVLMKDKLKSYDSILLNTLRTGRLYQHVEAVLATSMGPLHVMAHTDLLKDKNGKIYGSILSIRDISEQKQLEEQVFQSEKFELVGEIAAGIANEVRNPLTSILGLLQLLEGQSSSDSVSSSYIKIIMEEIHRLNIIISEFLLMSRPIVPIRHEAAMHDLLNDALLQLDNDIVSKNITVTRKYSDSLPLINLDTEQVKHVFINIISNALFAMNVDGQLEIRTEYRENTNIITFTDNGCGMDYQTVDRIFEPFFTTRGDSTGLGLTVSKRIIHNHGGKIEVDSTPGQGSIFKIILPVNNETKP